ncbi:uncharacterized protein BX663DRAFT_520848 [Cokeromyces recurvatus]|uniref:uncharacterized protein n=1 Tax=Cokeromyces recurvatus TaxID=90255 RepID=UPI00221E7D80|nr:uncharacterized protein BX663DRAFT_520848 [Cokeromyces recurvatus]KAI7899650.1 hypothetical protein BX663DRAFT_520848 [Cokeromyces recurvatus]
MLQFFLDRNGKEVQEVEIPVTSTPIFEGHLYIRTAGTKHWQWRLFRFDGSCFTCLSTRKTKLPPNTLYKHYEENDLLLEQNQYPLTSPLLATPKDKNKRLIASNTTELKYYQLPEWSIDIIQISSISVLKRTKRSPLQSSQYSKCFSIRTLDSNCVTLKAQTQKDLERWLFVLTKMWKFTQAVKEQMLQTFPYSPPVLVQAHTYHPTPMPTPTPIPTSTPTPTPILSNEKIKVIEEWRRSLAELMANDPTIRVSSPPPIEPIPDDDTMSIFTDMTSISHRPKTMIKRRPTRSTTFRRNNKINNMNEEELSGNNDGENKAIMALKKKRSDDVRNWMNHDKPLLVDSHKKSLDKLISHDNITKEEKKKKKMMMMKKKNTQLPPYINYFQDVTTTICDDELGSYDNHQRNNKLIYHSSVRGKKLIQINHQEEEEKKKKKEEERSHRYILNRPSSLIYPTTKRSSTISLLDDHLLLDQQKIYSLSSPLQFLPAMMTTSADKEEENMTLADLQKSLNQIVIHNNDKQQQKRHHHTRSHSSCSTHELNQQPIYCYSLPSIVAPAVPPQRSSFYLFEQQKKMPTTSFSSHMVDTAATTKLNHSLPLNHNSS